MNVVIVGGSGLVGRALTRSLVDDDATVTVLSRDARKRRRQVDPRAAIRDWSPGDGAGLAASLDAVDAVVCVAGARVAPIPWTRRRKRTIASSRVDTVRAVVDAIARLSADRRPRALVVVSGIDAYPETPSDDAPPWGEEGPTGSEFLAEVSRAIEAEARRAEGYGVRVARLRQGHVLARDADLVWFLALPVKLFVGGRLGGGRQWMSWVHIDDSVGLFRRALEDAAVDGVLNVTSPGAVHQLDFVRAMARVLHRPARFPTPAWLLRLVLGEQSVLLLGSRRVAPARAVALGYDFHYRSVDVALEDVLG